METFGINGPTTQIFIGYLISIQFLRDLGNPVSKRNRIGSRENAITFPWNLRFSRKEFFPELQLHASSSQKNPFSGTSVCMDVCMYAGKIQYLQPLPLCASPIIV